jgi:hypothetical protein
MKKKTTKFSNNRARLKEKGGYTYIIDYTIDLI